MGNACTRRNALHCPREAKDVDAPALATRTPVTSAEEAQKVSRADCHDGHDEIIGFDGSSNTPNQELFKPAKALQNKWMMEGSPSPPKPGIVGGKEGIENKPPSNGLDQVQGMFKPATNNVVAPDLALEEVDSPGAHQKRVDAAPRKADPLEPASSGAANGSLSPAGACPRTNLGGTFDMCVRKPGKLAPLERSAPRLSNGSCAVALRVPLAPLQTPLGALNVTPRDNRI